MNSGNDPDVVHEFQSLYNSRIPDPAIRGTQFLNYCSNRYPGINGIELKTANCGCKSLYPSVFTL